MPKELPLEIIDDLLYSKMTPREICRTHVSKIFNKTQKKWLVKSMVDSILKSKEYSYDFGDSLRFNILYFNLEEILDTLTQKQIRDLHRDGYDDSSGLSNEELKEEVSDYLEELDEKVYEKLSDIIGIKSIPWKRYLESKTKVELCNMVKKIVLNN